MVNFIVKNINFGDFLQKSQIKKTVIFPLGNSILKDRNIFAPLVTIDLSGRPVGRTRDDPDYLAILGTPENGGCLIIQFLYNYSINFDASRCGRAPSGGSAFKKMKIFETKRH